MRRHEERHAPIPATTAPPEPMVLPQDSTIVAWNEQTHEYEKATLTEQRPHLFIVTFQTHTAGVHVIYEKDKIHIAHHSGTPTTCTVFDEDDVKPRIAAAFARTDTKLHPLFREKQGKILDELEALATDMFGKEPKSESGQRLRSLIRQLQATI